MPIYISIWRRVVTLRCEGSKSGSLHYFGNWLIQQPVRPYLADVILSEVVNMNSAWRDVHGNRRAALMLTPFADIISSCQPSFWPSGRASQRSCNRCMIPNKHGRHHTVGFNIKMTSLDRPACGHVCWGRSASQSTASNASALVIGRKKYREWFLGLLFVQRCTSRPVIGKTYM